MRTKRTVYNVVAALAGQALSILIGLVSRGIFVKYLGITYLGLNGLFTNIISTLSLAELGIGTAMTYNIYKPLAEKDRTKVNIILKFYANVYSCIGGVILIIGLALLPFLKYIVNDVEILYAQRIFVLFLINSVITYFYSYKRTIIFANQRNYIITIIHYSMYIVMNILQILVIKRWTSFEGYLIVQICFTLLENIIINIIANKMYPYIKNKHVAKIDKHTKNKIIKDAKALFVFKAGRLLMSNQDNIIISTLVGMGYVGFYSNYMMLINSVISILTQVFNSTAASLGNLNVLETREKKQEIFEGLTLINFCVVNISTVCIFVLINPFIKLWLGEEFLLSKAFVIIISFNFYLNATRIIMNTFRDSMGLFQYGKYRPIMEAFTNLFLSIIFAKELGIVGIVLGTAISSFIFMWLEPMIINKYLISGSLKRYIFKYIISFGVASISITISYLLGQQFSKPTLLNIISQLVICIIVSSISCLIAFWRLREFKFLVNKIKRIKFKQRGE